MSVDFIEENVEYIAPYDLNEHDCECIRRLQALRDSGAVNMFTDVRRGLVEVFSEEVAQETWIWIQSNSGFYLSGNWTDMDV